MKILISILVFLLAGCSIGGPSESSYKQAEKAQSELCKAHGGAHRDFGISPLSFNCQDGSFFRKHGDIWVKDEQI